MTTQEAINEIQENISTYPEIRSIEIFKFSEIILHFNNGRKDVHIKNGLFLLEWMEENLQQQTNISIDQSIICLEKSLNKLTVFDSNEKIDFILDIVGEYKKQLKTGKPKTE